LRDVAFERTPARRVRGEYLVTGLLQCFVCHSPRDWSKPGAPAVTGRAGAGRVWGADRPWLVAPNLTPDAETGIGRWTDDMLVRSIREGIAHDGRVLHPQMWSSSFRRLSDEDVASVVVYLRLLKPLRNPLPATQLPADVAKDLDVPEPLNAPVHAPDVATPVARGRYLAGLADCSGCHTSWHTPKNPGLFGGGNLIEREGHSVFSSNLTSDASGLAHYDAALFRAAMRTGRLQGRVLDPVMPWIVFRRLTDQDLDALFAYLRAIRPVRHLVDNVNRAAPCAVCGGTHPLGEYNKVREIAPVAYSLADVRDFVGSYRFEDGFTLTFAIESGKFVLKLDGEPACEVVTEDRRHFFCRDNTIDVVEFVRDATGRVTHLLSNNVDPAPRVR
jgi:mono/diheme cytochrome c family protein